jgi:hypothetical protein
MRETYEMPSWVAVGRKVVAIHYYSSATGNPYSESLHMTISRVLKTQVEVEYLGSDKGRIVTKKRKFQLGRNGLYETGNKYNPDQLAPEGGKWILSIRADKAVEQHKRLIRETAASFGKESARWLTTEEVDEFQKKLSELAVTLGELEERRDLIAKMDKDAIVAV